MINYDDEFNKLSGILPGDFQKAMRNCEELLKENCLNINALLCKSEIYFQQRKFKEANEILDGILLKFPEHPGALWKKFIFFEKLGHYEYKIIYSKVF